jgi:hypothetical protein
MSKVLESELSDVELEIVRLRDGLQESDPAPLLDAFRTLARIRGSETLDLISTIAWAAEAVCSTAANADRKLNFVESASLRNAVETIDRARLTPNCNSWAVSAREM